MALKVRLPFPWPAPPTCASCCSRGSPMLTASLAPPAAFSVAAFSSIDSVSTVY